MQPRLLLVPHVTELEWVIKPEIEEWEAFAQLAETNYPDFVRYGLTQITHGSIGDDLAARMLDRIPIELGRAVLNMNLRDPEPFEHLIREIDAPLLLAKHEGCLGSTDEGFEDAVAAFPDAQTISVAQAPSVSSEFAEALRDFCTEVGKATTIRRSKSGA